MKTLFKLVIEQILFILLFSFTAVFKLSFWIFIKIKYLTSTKEDTTQNNPVRV